MPWPVWRVWLSGFATLEEMNRWTILDCVEANEALDVKEDCEYMAQQEQENRNG